jgi:hypothetical protein
MEIWQIPGLDGYNVHLLGKGDSQSTFTCVLFGIETGLQAWVDSLRALQGQIVTITNEQGTVITNQLIVSVGEPKKRTANDLVSTTQRWELQLSAITMS